MPLGGYDAARPTQIASAFSTINDLMLRNNMAENQVAQDQADKMIAQGALQKFQADTAPDEAGTPRNAEETIRAATAANATLAQSGGRHSQAASKQVMDYLEAKIKMHPAARPLPPMFKEVSPEGYNGPHIVKQNGVQYEEAEYMDVNSGKRIPGSTHWNPHNPPTSMFGNAYDPSKNIGGLTEEDPETKQLRIKRGPDGKPIKVTRAEITRLQQAESDNLRQLSLRLDWLKNQHQLEQAQLDMYRMQYAEDPENSMLGTAINNYSSALEKRAEEVQKQEQQVSRSQSFLKELDNYDPEKVYPTGGPNAPAAGVKGKGFASRMKTNNATQH